MATAQGVTREARQAAHAASPWIERLGRAGLAAKGIVYLLMGLLAAQAALGSGDGPADKTGALARILQAPFGRLLLALIAVGLVGYGLWRLVQAGFDTERKGSEPRGLLVRASYAFSGAIYLGLALSAVRLLLYAAAGSSEQTTQDLTARAQAAPAGAWLVAIAGLVVIGVGLAQEYRAWTADFCDKLRLGSLSPDLQQTVVALGRLGYAARGVVLVLIGLFLVVAALHAEPGEARGLGGALATLLEQPFGPWLLGGVALGLLAYGAFECVEARFSRLAVP